MNQRSIQVGFFVFSQLLVNIVTNVEFGLLSHMSLPQINRYFLLSIESARLFCITCMSYSIFLSSTFLNAFSILQDCDLILYPKKFHDDWYWLVVHFHYLQWTAFFFDTSFIVQSLGLSVHLILFQVVYFNVLSYENTARTRWPFIRSVTF